MISPKLLSPLHFLLILGAFISSGKGQGLDPIFEKMLDEYIENTFIPAIQVPGLTLAVVYQGQVALAKGYGYANVERGIKTANNSLFGVGSISKTILSTVAIKLLHEKFPQYGAGVLDAPIKELAPGYNFSFIDRYRYEAMSFRDLLAHIHCVCQSQLGLLVGAAKTREEFVYRTRYEGQCCRYRTGTQSYSNTIYALAGEVLAHIAGTDTDTLVVDTMRQMGMPYAQYFKTDGSHEKLPNLSQGYFWKDGKNHLFNVTLLRKIGNAPGGGAVTASALDIGAFLLFHLNRGVYNGTQVIPAEALEWQFGVSIQYQFGGYKQNSEDNQITGAFGYGLGITCQIFDGWLWLTHAGIFGPYNNKISAFPMKNFAVFTGVNQGTRQDKGHDELHLLIFNAMREFEKGNRVNPFEVAAAKLPKEFLKSLSKLDQQERLSWLPKLHPDQEKVMGLDRRDSWVKEWIPIQNLTGIFGTRVDGELEISNPNGTLFLHYGDWAQGFLYPITEEGEENHNKYTIAWTTQIEHQFYAAGWGEQDYSLHFQSPETFTFLQNGGGVVQFYRDSILENEPAHPWDPTSCSA